MEIPKTIDKRIVGIVVASLILFGITWRLTPHMPNFAPVSAIALALSASLGWRQSLGAVLVVMGVSDFLIGGYSSIEWTWFGFGLIVAFGHGIKKLPLSWRIPAGAIGASGVFFIVSNFGTWISSGMYSLDLTGLMQCYAMALPFLKATLVSDLVFSALLLISYELYLSYTHFIQHAKKMKPLHRTAKLYRPSLEDVAAR